MDKRLDIPAPIRQKLILTTVVGIVCMLTGLAMFIFAKDQIMLLLSASVCVLCIAKTYSLFRLAIKKEYETVEGTCVGISPKPMRKYRKIRIMDDEGNESAVLLNKQSKVKIGYRYRFFFKQTQRFSLGSEYLDAAMSSDHFLGYEELGELKTEE